MFKKIKRNDERIELLIKQFEKQSKDFNEEVISELSDTGYNITCSVERQIKALKKKVVSELSDVDCNIRSSKRQIEDFAEKTSSKLSSLKACLKICIFLNVTLIIGIIFLTFMNLKMQHAIEAVNQNITVLMAETEEDEETAVNISIPLSKTEAMIFADAVCPVGNSQLYDKNKNTFYSDPDCTYAIVNPEFSTSSYIWGDDSKGNSILIYRLTNGSFAYIQSNYYVDLSSR